MAFPAFLDTCVMFSQTLNDVLLRTAGEGAYHLYRSADVLQELETALVREGRTTPARAARRIAHMRAAFPGAEVADYHSLIPSMACDPKDRHVLAAAVSGRVEVLVTFNLRDFPAASTDPHDLVAVSPDDFLLDQLDLHPALVERATSGLLVAASRPPLTLDDLAERLERADVPRFAEALRARSRAAAADAPPDR